MRLHGGLGSELQKVISHWQKDKPLSGLILDLRNNPGGVLNAAVDVVNTFISSGLIVYTEGREAIAYRCARWRL